MSNRLDSFFSQPQPDPTPPPKTYYIDPREMQYGNMAVELLRANTALRRQLLASTHPMPIVIVVDLTGSRGAELLGKLASQWTEIAGLAPQRGWYAIIDISTALDLLLGRKPETEEADGDTEAGLRNCPAGMWNVVVFAGVSTAYGAV